MNTAALSLSAAGTLIILLGLGCLAGGAALRHGKPENWPDIVATDAVVRKISRSLFIVSILLLLSGVLTLLRVPWGNLIGAISTLVFVVGGFWGNVVLFGDYRPKHTITNLILGCVIWLLLYKGLIV